MYFPFCSWWTSGRDKERNSLAPYRHPLLFAQGVLYWVTGRPHYPTVLSYQVSLVIQRLGCASWQKTNQSCQGLTVPLSCYLTQRLRLSWTWPAKRGVQVSWTPARSCREGGLYQSFETFPKMTGDERKAAQSRQTRKKILQLCGPGPPLSRGPTGLKHKRCQKRTGLPLSDQRGN